MKIRALAIALLVLGSAASAPADDLKELAKDANSSVLLLRVLDRAGREISSGTGFYSSTDGLLVTNHHVISSAHRVVAIPAEGAPLEIRGVVAEDEVNDLAVLRVDRQGTSPLPLARGQVLEPGERIVVLGGPLGLAGTLSEGIVSAIRSASELEHHEPGASPLLQITAAISPGSSGSPVMRMDGEVVGVVVSQFRYGQNLNFAVPVTALRELLDGIGPGTPEVPLAAVAGATSSHYLRNIAISTVFFALLFFGLKRLR